MSDWKITGHRSRIEDKVEAVASTIVSAPFKMLCGHAPTVDPPNQVYTVENTQTGETREVYGKNETEAGENIQRGYFADEDE